MIVNALHCNLYVDQSIVSLYGFVDAFRRHVMMICRGNDNKSDLSRLVVKLRRTSINNHIECRIPFSDEVDRVDLFGLMRRSAGRWVLGPLYQIRIFLPSRRPR